ncbi:hypothetical protein QMA02_16560, partial [Bacillus wiedmannii]|nr:hypothetical protein [Bacillus wiedmannii]
SSAGVWVGYFAFEKGTERFTTQDIRISLGSDVKSGSVRLENYIAEFDKLKKQIDTLQIAVDKADVVKRSGDTMKGHLEFRTNKELQFKRDDGVSLVGMAVDSAGDFFAWNSPGNRYLWKLDGKTGEFAVNADNLMYKGGGTLTGNVHMEVGASEDRRLAWSKDDKLLWGFTANGDTNLQMYDWKNSKSVFAYDGASFEFRQPVKFSKDTDWTPLTLLNGVKQQSSQPASAVKRSGNVVNIVCAITDFKDKQVIANVPAIFRPDREMFFTPNFFQGLALKTGYVIVKPNGDIYLEGIEASVSLYRFSLTYIV